MSNKNENFYNWMRSKLTQSPPASIDHNILSLAKKEFNQSKKSRRWLMPANAIAASLIIFIASSIYYKQHKNLNNMVLSESPEMILNYKNIELMAVASQLSEDDWKNIEGTK